MKYIFTLSFLLLSFLTFSQTEYTVNTELLNVRSGAGTEYGVVGQIKKNDKIVEISKYGNWSEIKTDELQGFVSSKYISPLNEKSESEKDDNSIFSWLIALAIIVFITIKVKNFFTNLFSGGNSRSKTQSSYSKPTVKTQTIKHICKHCGQEDKSLNSLTFHTCHRSPTKKHQPFEGGIQEKYICKHCGQEDKSLNSLTFHTCHRSPTKNHQPFEGGIRPKYMCKHCGHEDKSLNSLTFHTCHRSPTKKHQPLF